MDKDSFATCYALLDSLKNEIYRLVEQSITEKYSLQPHEAGPVQINCYNASLRTWFFSTPKSRERVATPAEHALMDAHSTLSWNLYRFMQQCTEEV